MNNYFRNNGTVGSITFQDIVDSYRKLKDALPQYYASLEVQYGMVYILDPATIGMSGGKRCIYHPLSDPPGTYTTKKKELE